MDKQLDRLLGRLVSNAESGLAHVIAEQSRLLQATMRELKKTFEEEGNPLKYKLAISRTEPESSIKGIIVIAVEEDFDLDSAQEIDPIHLVEIGVTHQDDVDAMVIMFRLKDSGQHDQSEYRYYMEKYVPPQTEEDSLYDMAYGVTRHELHKLSTDVIAFLLEPFLDSGEENNA